MADSYGYRHDLSAHDAITKARERCFKYGWVLDMDISKFFDTIDHEMLMKAVECHVKFANRPLLQKRVGCNMGED